MIDAKTRKFQKNFLGFGIKAISKKATSPNRPERQGYYIRIGVAQTRQMLHDKAYQSSRSIWKIRDNDRLTALWSGQARELGF